MEGSRRFDGYGRVSRRQGRKGPGYISPDVQREGVQRWADYSGVIIDQWHFDEDKTGRNQNRPGMREAIRRVENHESEGIVCLKLNRFGRNVIGALDDIRRIRAAGAEIVFVEDQIDTSGPSGNLMLTVMLAIAEWEHENFSANFEIAKRRAVARGAYVSRTPFGYARREDGTIAPHPETSVIVKEAFRLASSEGIHSALDFLRVAYPQRAWTTTKVRRLLAGRSYLGEVRNGEHVKTNAHPELVSRAVWEAAQTTPLSRRTRDDFPLSGLARCGTCDQPMIGSRGGVGQRTYRCSGTQARPPGFRCEAGAVITASILEEYVISEASKFLAALRATISGPETDDLDRLERAMYEAESELEEFASDLTVRRLLGDRYHAHLEERAQAYETAQEEYRAYARRSQEKRRMGTIDLLSTDDAHQMMVGLRGLLEAVVVSRGRGLKVEDRVQLVPFSDFVDPLDDDSLTGIPVSQEP